MKSCEHLIYLHLTQANLPFSIFMCMICSFTYLENTLDVIISFLRHKFVPKLDYLVRISTVILHLFYILSDLLPNFTDNF